LKIHKGDLFQQQKNIFAHIDQPKGKEELD